MSPYWQLGDILVDCRLLSRQRWQQIASLGDLNTILDAIAAEPPPWWDGQPPAPSGLTDYQRWMIESRWEAREFSQLRHDLALNQFILLEKLGQGGQGEVYRGRQLNPPRYVALKTLVRETETSRRRFEQEARAMMQIQHSAIARFYLYERVRDPQGQPTDEYVIAMELVEGMDLNRIVRRGGRVPWPFAVKWTIDILGGLSAIHQAGFIHRDIKPENIMIVGPPPAPAVPLTESHAKLLDFGVVTCRTTSSQPGTRTDLFVGTREYAPPEQWSGQGVPASDLYALGGTLFFALTGRTPFQKLRRDPEAYRLAHAQEAVPDLCESNPDVPKAVNALFQQMMTKSAAERGSIEELIAGFHAVLNPRPTGRHPTPLPRPQPVPLSKSTAVPPSLPRVKSSRDGDGHPGPYRWIDGLMHVLERAFIPGHLRPLPGHEPSMVERLIALLRRPMVLIVLAVGLGLLLWLWVR